MVKRRDRIIAMVIAIAFFATSFALSFFVIWELYKDNKEAKTVNQSTNVPADETRTPLQGTQLANFTPLENIEKLERLEVTPGTGAEVKAGQQLTVDYTGALASTGVIFESSLDSGRQASFSLNRVIKGWTDGLPGAKVGGKYRLLIPSDLAYGPGGQGDIPPNADLVFDITIHSAQ